jgi:hypothetical protein
MQDSVGAKKLLIEAAESPPSAERFVGRRAMQNLFLE